MPRLTLSLILLLFATFPAGAEQPLRAKPPEFTDTDRAPFFNDAQKALVGERPDYSQQKGSRRAKGVSETALVVAAAGDTTRWSDWVDTDTLETEIKRQSTRLTEATRSSAFFKASGHETASNTLGLVALLFAVTAEHDGDPRWHDSAAGLRELFATAVDDADDNTDEAFAIAQSRAADLADLIRGGRPTAPQSKPLTDWSELAYLSALMQRMMIAEEKKLPDWLADARQFRRHAEDVRHEAQVLALLAEAMTRPGADYADDEDYTAFANQLRQAAADLTAAAESEDHPAAERAMLPLRQSCARCHEDYRG